jgi:hypothetical protein
MSLSYLHKRAYTAQYKGSCSNLESGKGNLLLAHLSRWPQDEKLYALDDLLQELRACLWRVGNDFLDRTSDKLSLNHKLPIAFLFVVRVALSLR